MHPYVIPVAQQIVVKCYEQVKALPPKESTLVNAPIVNEDAVKRVS